MSAWVVIISIGLGSYALRASMFVLLGNRSLPGWTATPMALVAPAAIAALVATITLTDGGQIRPLPLAELAAMMAGFVVVRRTGNVMHAFAAGLPVFWVLTLAGI